MTGQPERLTDIQIEALDRWLNVIAHKRFSGVQLDRMNAAIDDLRNTRAELRRLQGVRDAVVAAMKMRTDHNLLIRVALNEQGEPVWIRGTGDEAPLAAYRALIATTPPDGAEQEQTP